MPEATLVPRVLILASKFDISCDYVVAQIKRRGAACFRLNSEDFDQFSVVSVPYEGLVSLRAGDINVNLTQETLKAVYFRRGVYPREAFTAHHSPQEQLNRTHRSVFMRSFMTFDSCLWINHPVSTYKAEHKAVQLALARSVGFDLPRTVITNDASGIAKAAKGDSRVAVKGLDTVLVWENGQETFGYTTLIDTKSAGEAYLSSAPLIAQEALENKLDLRVTVVGKQAFCASVTRGGDRIEGDWRLNKDGTKFQPFDLPDDVTRKCRRLTELLGLTFGAIDLALQDGVYYFLEVNPTGEWGWLVDQAGLPIDKAIGDTLLEAP